MMKKHRLVKVSVLIILILGLLIACNSKNASQTEKTTHGFVLEDEFTWKGYKAQTYHFMNHENEENEFYLLLPDTPHNSPLVILIHGYTDKKESWLDSEYTHGEVLTKRLLEQNAAVVLVDLPYHGFHSDKNVNPPGSIWLTTVYPIFIQKFIESIGIILENLNYYKEIDCSRIALVGYSLGSAVSLPLINELPEIDTAVLCVPPALTYNTTEEGPLKSAEHVTIPVRLISAAEDDVINNVKADTKILYDAIPAEHKDHIWYESGHSLPVAYIDSVMEWLSDFF